MLEYLICLPVYLIKYGMAEVYYVKKITSGYDYLFFKSKNMKAVTRHMKKVKQTCLEFQNKKGSKNTKRNN